jgi:hypothetical protein
LEAQNRHVCGVLYRLGGFKCGAPVGNVFLSLLVDGPQPRRQEQAPLVRRVGKRTLQFRALLSEFFCAHGARDSRRLEVEDGSILKW